MQMHALTAANTLSQPKRKRALETFLQNTYPDSDAHSDQGEHVGAKVKEHYKGKWIKGTVVSTCDKGNEQIWVVRFDDKYVKHYTRKDLEKILIRTVAKKVGRQLDYVLVSSRWKSCVVSCKPKWGPSIHRDLHGERNDHALVECRWQ